MARHIRHPLEGICFCTIPVVEFSQRQLLNLDHVLRKCEGLEVRLVQMNGCYKELDVGVPCIKSGDGENSMQT